MTDGIRICFFLFINHLKQSNIEISDTQDVDIECMSINEIKDHINILYMKYILSKMYTISNDSVVTVAHNHLIRMIDSYNLNNINQTRETNQTKEKTKKKGWIY